RLKEFSHARQTAGDVFGFRGLAGRFGHQGSGDNAVALIDDDVRAGRNRIIGGGFTAVIDNDDLRVQIFLVFDDDHGFLRGGFIDFLLHGDTFDNIDEFHLAGFLGKDRNVVGVPLHEGFALLDLGAVGDGNDRADDEVMRFEFAAIFAEDQNRAVLVEDDVVAVFKFDQA